MPQLKPARGEILKAPSRGLFFAIPPLDLLYPIGYYGGVRDVEETETFTEWIEALDENTRGRILVRIDRLKHGNPGDQRALKGGIKELKLNFGPGYRVYYTERGKTLIVLLAGGDKATQAGDIKAATDLAKNLKEPKK